MQLVPTAEDMSGVESVATAHRGPSTPLVHSGMCVPPLKALGLNTAATILLILSQN